MNFERCPFSSGVATLANATSHRKIWIILVCPNIMVSESFEGLHRKWTHAASETFTLHYGGNSATSSGNYQHSIITNYQWQCLNWCSDCFALLLEHMTWGFEHWCSGRTWVCIFLNTSVHNVYIISSTQLNRRRTLPWFILVLVYWHRTTSKL